MASYLRSWLFTGIPQAPPSNETVQVPTIQTISPPASDEEDDEGSATETERDRDVEDDDVAPAFPSLNSAQRVRSTPQDTSKAGGPKIWGDSDLMPPPPVPGLAVRKPGVRFSTPATTSSLLAPPPQSASSSLALPPSTTKPPPKPSKKRGKVALAPGHSPLDWAKLKSSGADLRGVDTLMRVPPSLLKQHNKRDDAWSAFYGKVYNITPYLPFHPGGERELMRVAGRDGTKLFAETHGWVNADMMLDTCLVGFLVPEPS